MGKRPEARRPESEKERLDRTGVPNDPPGRISVTGTNSIIEDAALDLESPEESGISARDESARAKGSRLAANAAMDRYASGDDAAFSELYDLIAPKLHGYLLRQTHDPVRTEDLLQQTMLQLHSHRGRFIVGGEVLSWAFAIARRLLINSYRRRKREASGREVQAAELPPFSMPIDDLVDSKRITSTIETELSRLPEAQRVAIELIKKDGLSMREVAEVLGTTSNAVKLRVHRAYVALRIALAKRADADGG